MQSSAGHGHRSWSKYTQRREWQQTDRRTNAPEFIILANAAGKIIWKHRRRRANFSCQIIFYQQLRRTRIFSLLWMHQLPSRHASSKTVVQKKMLSCTQLGCLLYNIVVVAGVCKLSVHDKSGIWVLKTTTYPKDLFSEQVKYKDWGEPANPGSKQKKYFNFPKMHHNDHIFYSKCYTSTTMRIVQYSKTERCS